MTPSRLKLRCLRPRHRQAHRCALGQRRGKPGGSSCLQTSRPVWWICRKVCITLFWIFVRIARIPWQLHCSVAFYASRPKGLVRCMLKNSWCNAGASFDPWTPSMARCQTPGAKLTKMKAVIASFASPIRGRLQSSIVDMFAFALRVQKSPLQLGPSSVQSAAAALPPWLV